MKKLLNYVLIVSLSVLAFNAQADTIFVDNSIIKTEHSYIKDIKKQLFKWNMYINKEVPKRMRVLKSNPSVGIVLFTMFLSVIYGILHTLGPGHGKMIVASYLLTHDSKLRNGVKLGILYSFTHVGSAIALIYLVDITLRNVIIGQSQQMYYLKLISFSLIVVIGFILFLKSILKGIKQKKFEKIEVKNDKALIMALGMVPCTGSLLILLYSMAHDILMLGILMTIGVAIGMSVTIILIGIIAIIGKKKVINKFVISTDKFFRYGFLLEMVGALFIIAVGGVLLSSI